MDFVNVTEMSFSCTGYRYSDAVMKWTSYMLSNEFKNLIADVFIQIKCFSRSVSLF